MELVEVEKIKQNNPAPEQLLLLPCRLPLPPPYQAPFTIMAQRCVQPPGRQTACYQ